MKRDEALADFSRDHLPALRQAKYLKEAGTDESATPPEEVAKQFLTFWDDEASLHFIEEELVILPVLSREGPVTERETIRTMIDDHAWFRDKVSELRTLLEDEEDVTSLVREIGERFERHARMEEQEIFEQLQEELEQDELGEIHRRSEAFREQRRPDSIGPRT